MKTSARVTASIVAALTLLVSLQPPSYAQPLTTRLVYLPIVNDVAAACRRVAFGIIGLAADPLARPDFNAGVVEGVGPGSLISTLASARASHVMVMLALAGPRTGFQNPDGSFSLSKWEAQMAPFNVGLDVSSYVADGTLLGDGMIDEPQDPSNWGGHTVAAADIDAAAQYARGIFPTMPMFVGSWATWLQSTGHPWQYLNGVFTPYIAKRGDVGVWTTTQIAAAQAQSLAVYMNMNVMAGGATGGKMTAAELLSFGTTLINATYSRGTFMQDWSTDPGYYSQPDIASSLAQLSALAAQRQACQ